MAKTVSLNIFRDFAICSLARCMAKHKDDTLPATAIGDIIAYMTGWDKTDLYSLVNLFRKDDQASVLAEDADFLLNYAPSRRFASAEEIIEWFSSISSIRSAIDTAAYWGFLPRNRKPKPPSLWNSFLLAGLNILARQKDGSLQRDRMFFLFSLLGMDQPDALRAIAVQKG